MSTNHKGRDGKAALKFETTWGTGVTADRPIRLMSESIKPEYTKVTDEALISEVFTTQRVKVAENYGGSVELAAHPEESGPLMYWTLGAQSAVAGATQAYVMITYTGSENYWRLTKSGNDITSETSSDGSSWSADSNFGTAGVIDISAVGTTATALATEIDGYSDYISTYKGYSGAVSTLIADFAATNGKEAGDFQRMFALRYVDATSTTTKNHTITSAAATVSLPSTSLVVDRTKTGNESYRYTGTKVASANIAVSAADMMKYSLTVTCKDEDTGQTYPALTIPTNRPNVAPKICVWINGIKQDECKDFTIGINSNLTQDNVLCSYTIIEQIRQAGEITFSGTFNLDDTATTGNAWIRGDAYKADKPVEVVIYIEAPDYADETNNIYFSTLIRMNKVDLDDAAEALEGPGIITVPISGVVVDNSNGYSHIEMDITDDETTTYA